MTAPISKAKVPKALGSLPDLVKLKPDNCEAGFAACVQHIVVATVQYVELERHPEPLAQRQPHRGWEADRPLVQRQVKRRRQGHALLHEPGDLPKGVGVRDADTTSLHLLAIDLPPAAPGPAAAWRTAASAQSSTSRIHNPA